MKSEGGVKSGGRGELGMGEEWGEGRVREG